MVFIFVCLLLVYLVHQIFDIKNLYNPFVSFFLYHTVFLFIALSYKDVYSKSIQIYSGTVAIIVSSYITIFLGALSSLMILQTFGYKYYKSKDIKITDSNNSYSKYSGYLILLIGFSMAIYFIVDTGGLLFFKEDLENSRIIDRKGRGLLTLLTISFITFGYLQILVSKGNVLFKGMFLLVSCFFLISFGNRAPMLELVVLSFILFLTYKRTPIKFKYLLSIGLFVFTLMVLFGAIRANSKYSVFDLFVAQYGWRPFVNIQNLQWIIDYFPSHADFLYGRTILIEMKLFLPGSNPNFGQWLKEFMDIKFDGGSITTTHLGVAYINFGYIGAFLYPFFLGFLFQSINQLLINKQSNSPLKLTFCLMLSLYLGGTISSGLVSVLIMNVMFLCFVGLCYICAVYFFRASLPTKNKAMLQNK